MSTNLIIKGIHSEFSEAEENLLKDVELQLKRSEEVDREDLKKLSSLGFTNFREIREVQPEEIEKISKIQSLVNKYRSKTTLYKFITDEKIIELCKKWGLVHAPVNLYKDSIPYKNQKEILKFHNWSDSHRDLLPEENLQETVNSINGSLISELSTQSIIFQLILLTEAWVKDPIFLSGETKRQIFSSRIREINEEDLPVIFSDLLRELYKRGNFESKKQLKHFNEGKSNLFIKCDFDTYLTLKRASDIDQYVEIHQLPVSSFDNRKPFVLYLKGFDLRFPPFSKGLSILLKELYPETEYSIVAAKHMLDLDDNYYIDQDYKCQKKAKNFEFPLISQRFFKDDDPIVLSKVEGGYYIVTAWGDEASDSNIVNQSLN